MQNLKCDGQEVIYETDTDTRTQRTDLWLPWGREELAVWGWWMQTIIYRMDKQ